MKRAVTATVVMLAVLAATAAGLGAYWLVREPGTRLPEISAYSHAHLVRVGPYRYCKVLDIDDCAAAGSMGELPVTPRDRVQLSVPTAIGRAPWVLVQVYQDGALRTPFAPGSRLAVTIPTIDPNRGQLQGFAVQLWTVVPTPDGELLPALNAEWSVHTVWP